MNRPVSLTIAVVLQWIAAVLYIITGVGVLIGAFATLNSNVRDQITTAFENEGVTGVSAGMITAGVFIAGLVTIGIAIIRVIVAMSLARGHNWARILITIIVALGMLSSIGALIGGQWAALAPLAVELVILWLMWNASSSAYIKFKTAERAVAAAS